MRSQKAGLVGVAAVGVERYLRWEIAGDVLRLRERETVVDMRLGDYFRAVSSVHFEANPEATLAWLCFLSFNDVILRFRFAADRGTPLLTALVEAADGKCFQLNTEYILTTRTLSCAGGACLVDLFYACLDLGAEQAIAASHWSQHDRVAVGFNTGEAVVAQLLPDSIHKTVISAGHFMDSLLSGIGLMQRRPVVGAVRAVAALSELALVLTQDGQFHVWSLMSHTCIERSSIGSLLGISSSRRVCDGVLVRTSATALALGLRLETERGDAQSGWTVIVVTVPRTGTSSSYCSVSVLAPPRQPSPSAASLLDVALVGPDKCLAVWACDLENVLVTYPLTPGHCQGKETHLGPASSWLAALRLEDTAICASLASASEEQVQAALLRRVFYAGRFPVEAVVTALDQDVPQPLQRRATGNLGLCEDLMRAVAEVCSEWAALQQDDLVAVYLAFLDSCHRRTLEVASAQSGSLEYRPSGDKSLVAVVGIDRSPGLIDLRECPAQSLDETLITAMEESIPRQVYAAVGARIVDLVSRGIVDADSLGAAVEDGAQALDFATLRQLASTDLTAAQHATLASFPTLRRGGIVPTLFDERSECLLAADHARAGLLAQWRRSLAAALAGVAKRKVMSGQALLSSDLSAKQDSLPMTLHLLAYFAFLRWTESLHMDCALLMHHPNAWSSAPQCATPLLDTMLGRRQNDTTGGGAGVCPLWDCLWTFMLGRYAGVCGSSALQDESWLRGLTAPSAASDVFVFLEAAQLFSVLAVGAMTMQGLALLASDGAAGIEYAHWRSLEGRCRLEASLRQFGGSVDIKGAADMVTCTPSVLSQPQLVADTLSQSLDGSRAAAFSRNVLLAEAWAHLTSSACVYSDVFVHHSLQSAATHHTDVLLCLLRVSQLQWMADRLRRMGSKSLLPVLITVGHKLIGAIEDCVIALVSTGLGDVGTAANLISDKKAAWMLVFEGCLGILSFHEALAALISLRELCDGDSSLVTANLAVLLNTACSQGRVGWIASFAGPLRLEAAALLEWLHLTRDFGSILHFDCLIACLSHWEQFAQVARVANSLAERSSVDRTSFAYRWRSLAIAFHALESIDEDYAYVIARSAQVSSYNSLMSDANGAQPAGTDLVLVSKKNISLQLSMASCRRLLGRDGMHDTDNTEETVRQLTARGFYSEACFLARALDAAQQSRGAYRYGPVQPPQAYMCSTFDTPSGHVASSLASGLQQYLNDTRLVSMSCVPVSVLESTNLCELAEGSLKDIGSADVVLHKLVDKNELIEACKVAMWILEDRRGAWVSYTELDRMFVACEATLRSCAGKETDSQLSMCLQAVTHSLREHFLSLLVV